MAKKLTFTLKVGSVNKYRSEYSGSPDDRMTMTACTEKPEGQETYVVPDEELTLHWCGHVDKWPFDDDLGDTLTVTIEG